MQNIPLVDLAALRQELAHDPLAAWLDWLPQALDTALDDERNGNLPRFQQALDALPTLRAQHVDLRRDQVLIGQADEVDAAGRSQIEHALRGLMPWRKGPFEVFGVNIDTEWRSDWKWTRVLPHLAPLAGRRVLDVGCGSGYHLLRMRGAGAALAIGIDPSVLFTAQFAALRQLGGVTHAHVLPFPLEGLPAPAQGGRLGAFDTVFSMGVIYHRRDPQEHLAHLLECLRPGGQLLLEGLVIEGGEDDCLYPADTETNPSGRYAMMRNVWSVPSAQLLKRWMQQAGLHQVRIVDETRTTLDEQRQTDWMRYLSLAGFLDPHDPTRTVEGFPAPRRAILVAEK
ncbi:MAG: tRNA 5-methoxyuridine(34)/uridine 5-oxyacetic acid(34) synthase CmoB [Halothiobacillaceae bacterium]|nr:tRNA 5-methoxyuridine(34)/uridine 5-oxyacetic acid(34) synthase CmoB [Halothiobacillaceae bacterium]